MRNRATGKMSKKVLLASLAVLSCSFVAHADEVAFNTGKVSAILENCPAWKLTEDAANGPWSYLIDEYGETDDFTEGRADTLEYIQSRDNAELKQDCEEWFEAMYASGIRYFVRR